MPKNRDGDSSHNANSRNFNALDDEAKFNLLDSERGGIEVLLGSHRNSLHAKIQLAAVMAIWLQEVDQWQRFCDAMVRRQGSTRLVRH